MPTTLPANSPTVPSPRRPRTTTSHTVRCTVTGQAPFAWARIPQIRGHLTGRVIVYVGVADMIDELEAQHLARRLVYADEVTVRGSNPAGAERIRRTLDHALDQAAEEAHMAALAEMDLPEPTSETEAA